MRTTNLIRIIMVFWLSPIFAQNGISIIPVPNSIKENNERFTFNKDTKVAFNSLNPDLKTVADYLSYRMMSGMLIKPEFTGETTGANIVYLGVDNKLTNPEEYTLTINNSQIIIKGGSAAGVFYGVQTLLQLLPAEIFGLAPFNNQEWKVTGVEIADAPSFAYRGMHLDVGRHMYPVEFIKRFIDLLAMHKMNKFHWHLTEDQGWRIEIKKYPQLTAVGAFRDETVIGHARDKGQGDGTRYGGFYTQDEVREVVAYAQSRFVTVIPEIELPGHAQAALAAYPWLGCTGGPYNVATTFGVFDDVFCAGNESVFTFLQDVLDEVCELFPSEYIHIGGDECPKTRWEKCPKCQARIKSEGLRDEHHLQSYFISRIDKYLAAKGRKIIGWDEILEGGLTPGATVMSWRGIAGGVEAGKAGHNVIMTPNTHCYLDYYQADKQFEPLAIGGFLPLKKVYSFNPVPPQLEGEYEKYVIGAQANIWTEYMKTPEYVEYMAVPRLCALAEVVWSKKENRKWESFAQRLEEHKKRLKAMHVNYSEGSFVVDIIARPAEEGKAVNVELLSEQLNPEIRYTLDGSEPTSNSELYSVPFLLNKPATIKAAIFEKGKIYKGIATKEITIHKAIGAKVEYITPYHWQYTAGGTQALTEGVTGSINHNDGYWQGFHDSNAELIIDLGTETEISSVKINFLQNYRSWIFAPQWMEVYVSGDGTKFSKVEKVKNSLSLNEQIPVIQSLATSKLKAKVRYIKIVAKTVGMCPKGHPGEGQASWMFLDEIIVN